MAFSWLDLLQYFFSMLANGKRSVLTDATNIDHVCEFGCSIHFFRVYESEIDFLPMLSGNARRDARYP